MSDVSPTAAQFAEHRSLLAGIAYRMLGGVADAEDAVQDVYLRWQAQDVAQIASARAWLIAATTRLCIDRLRSTRREREQYVGVWLPEPVVEAGRAADPAGVAGLADSLSMAFMVMLDALSPVERAVFLLRRAFDYDYPEIARIVGRSEAACRQIVSRAGRSLADRGAVGDQPSRARAEELVERFLTATRTGALPELLALLSDNAVLYTDGGGIVPAARRPIVTADRIARFFVGVRRFNRAAAVRLVQVNGQPGGAIYRGDQLDRVLTVDFAGERIRTVYLVRNPQKLARVVLA